MKNPKRCGSGLTQYTDIYLEIARTITRRLSGGLYTNLGSPEYEARVLSIGTLFMYYHILILSSDVCQYLDKCDTIPNEKEWCKRLPNYDDVSKF